MKKRDIVVDEYGNTFMVVKPDADGDGRIVIVESVITKEQFRAPVEDLRVDPDREVF